MERGHWRNNAKHRPADAWWEQRGVGLNHEGDVGFIGVDRVIRKVMHSLDADEGHE